MEQIIYQIDAFAEAAFQGNPAAVCILRNWLPDQLLQNIALENNLSETAFVVKNEAFWEIRWFTPNEEVALCGHATLATAYVLFEEKGIRQNPVLFKSKYSGILKVEKTDQLFTLDFPADDYMEMPVDSTLEKIFGIKVLEQYKGKTDILLIAGTENEVANMKPDHSALKSRNIRGFIVSAPGDSVHFVSRFFCPDLGIDEDPVTGSAHTTLVPYWHKRTGLTEFKARQLSKRGGSLFCKFEGDRIKISGKAIKYMSGTIFLDVKSK
jgi:PhzF family phenazine biosynthesis protein